jgi:hypothetical protein
MVQRSEKSPGRLPPWLAKLLFQDTEESGIPEQTDNLIWSLAEVIKTNRSKSNQLTSHPASRRWWCPTSITLYVKIGTISLKGDVCNLVN